MTINKIGVVFSKMKKIDKTKLTDYLFELDDLLIKIPSCETQNDLNYLIGKIIKHNKHFNDFLNEYVVYNER
jgi:hypothetical protein